MRRAAGLALQSAGEGVDLLEHSEPAPVARVARTAPAIPDRVTVWPLDGFRFGVDVTYEGASGAELAARHEAGLSRAGVQHSFRQELRGAWTIA